nr:T9SS type A sorting domain-containing protein [Saprospiraceae bacterium]
MKKSTLLFFFWNLLCTGFILASININGFLLDPDGNPVTDHPIELEIQWTNSAGEHHQLITDAQGEFKLMLNRPGVITAKIIFTYLDCDNTYQKVHKMLPPNSHQLTVDLLYCRNSNTNDCKLHLRRVRDNSGDILIIARGSGTAPFSYEWSDGTTGDTFKLPEDRVFCVTMTDATGCQDVICHGTRPDAECKVKITRLPSNALNGFYLFANFKPNQNGVNFRWNTGDTTQSIFVDKPGRYCVEAISADGCIARTCVWIGRPNDDHVDCLEADILINYAPDRSYADLVINYDPNLNLEFEWNTGETTDRITVTQSGVYIVTIYDRDNDCIVRKRVFVNLNNADCSVKIEVEETAQGYELTAVTPFDTTGALVRYRWSTGENSQTILVTNPDAEYCVAIKTQRCLARACVVPANAARNISISSVYLPDYEAKLLKATSVEGEEIDVIWSDGTYGDYLIVDESGSYTAYALFNDGEVTEYTIDIQMDPKFNNNFSSTVIELYPNPTAQDIYVQIDQPISTGSKWTITDIQGKTVMEHYTARDYTSGEELSFNLSHLNPGIYFIVIRSDNQLHTSKFIKK